MSSANLPEPDAVCDGGDLDCGSGLLLIIRDAMKPLDAGQILEVRSTEPSVGEDLPAWCRMTGHGMEGIAERDVRTKSFFVRKQGADSDLEKHREEAQDFEWRVRIKSGAGMSARSYVRNHTLEIGQPASFDTEDAAASAVEHLLSALGSCVAVGLRWRLGREGFEVRHLEVSLRARAENVLVFLGIEDQGSPGFRAIRGTVFVDSDADPDRLEALFQDTLRRSPVAQTLLHPVDLGVRCRAS